MYCFLTFGGGNITVVVICVPILNYIFSNSIREVSLRSELDSVRERNGELETLRMKGVSFDVNCNRRAHAY